MVRAVTVKAIDNHKLLIKFDNGEQKIYNCIHLMNNKLFSRLRNVEVFKTVHVDDMGVVCWDNAMDINPYELYDNSERIEKM